MSTERCTFVALFALCSLTAGRPAAAHHSFTMFDTTNRVTVTGVVASCEWINPHVIVEIDGAEVDGGLKRWTVELSSPGALQRLGWSHDDLRYRSRITAVVYPLKSGAPGGLLVQATLADGRVLGNSGPAPR